MYCILKKFYYLCGTIIKKVVMRTTKQNLVLRDTHNADDYSYEEYVDWCEANELTPKDEDSSDYWDWVSEMADIDYDDFMFGIDHDSDPNDIYCITGTLGLWNGRPTIVPVMCESMKETRNGRTTYRSGLRLAIEKCIYDNGYYKIEYNYKTGCVEVEVSHHDGTNYFEIHKLSKYGRDRMISADSRGDDYNATPRWFKRINETELFY